MAFKTTRLVIIAALANMLWTISAPAEDKPQILTTVGTITVPFVISIEKEQYQTLLDKLPEVRIGIDKAQIIKTLATRLSREELVPSEGQTFESIATELYEENVLPVLEPRVAKFNEVMNQSVSADSVSAGFIAFAGLAKSMAQQTSGYPAMLIDDFYTYAEDEFEQGGTWKLNPYITETTHFKRTLSADIDEDIEFNLEPYGKKHTFTWDFSCSGEVSMEQSYDCRIIGNKTFKGKPTTTVRVRPSATVTAQKKISPGAYFAVTGKNYAIEHETFEHPAIHEIEVEAKPYED